MQRQVRAATQDTPAKASNSFYAGQGAAPRPVGLGRMAGLGSALGGICKRGSGSRFAQQQAATCSLSTGCLRLGPARLGGMKRWSELAFSGAYFFFSEKVLLKQLGFARGAKAAGMQQRQGQREAQANLGHRSDKAAG